MKHVCIADLKSRLSEYLRTVRRGETIAVLDRDTPVAQIVHSPWPGRTTGPEARARYSGAEPHPSAQPAKVNVNIVRVLLEERQGTRSSHGGRL